MGIMTTKTEQILKLTAPYNNHSQGSDRRLLFVCSVGMLRSPTAADIATKLGYNARSCGSSNVALIPLSVNLIAWSDSIIFMSSENYKQSLWKFEDHEWYDTLVSKSIVWNFNDEYNRNDPELIRLVTSAINNFGFNK